MRGKGHQKGTEEDPVSLVSAPTHAAPDVLTGYTWPAEVQQNPSPHCRALLRSLSGSTPECPRLALPRPTASHQNLHMEPDLSQAEESATGAFLVFSLYPVLRKQENAA